MAQSTKKFFTTEEVLNEIYHDADSGDEDFNPTDDSIHLDGLFHSDSESDLGEDVMGQEETLSSSSHSQSSDHSDLEEQPSTSTGTQGHDRGRGRGHRGRGARGGLGGHGVRDNRRGSRPRIQDRIWTQPTDDFEPTIPEFRGQPGIRIDVTGFKPIDFFLLFINNYLLEHFVAQTNLYAAEYLQATTLKPSARARRWFDNDPNEMLCFIGIILLMGIIRKPLINAYWSTDPLLRTPVFPAVMSRDRFLLLLKFWHLNDNRNMPPQQQQNRDRLFKIRPVLDHLMERFQDVYEPCRDITVDESLLLWKGRLIFKQYIPLKRARFGIKSFMLCDSSGYTFRFRVYAGKDENSAAVDNLLPPAAAPLGRSGKEVFFLMLPLLGKGYRLFIDNWYGSVDLFAALHEHGTSACGTMRANRVPACLRQARVQRGNTQSVVSNTLLAQKYVDKRDVYMLSSCHNATVNGGSKPPAVQEYNLKMGSVDRHDQQIHPYDATRKTLKWYKKLCIRFLQIAMLNAHILFIKAGNTGTFLDFQMAVIRQLIFRNENGPDHLTEDNTLRLTGRHFIDIIPPTDKRQRPQKKCKVCFERGTRKDTRYFCPQCPSQPALCLQTCFKRYHTERCYWRN